MVLYGCVFFDYNLQCYCYRVQVQLALTVNFADKYIKVGRTSGYI